MFCCKPPPQRTSGIDAEKSVEDTYTSVHHGLDNTKEANGGAGAEASERTHSGDLRYEALMLLCALSNACQMFGTHLVRKATGLSPIWLLLVRNTPGCLAVSVALIYMAASSALRSWPPGGVQWHDGLKQGLLGASAHLLTIYAITAWNFSDVALIQESQVIFTMLLSW